MSSFLRDAEEIFATAKQGGSEECDFSILVHRGGGIHVITDSGWTAESLLAHHGADAIYRVKRGSSGVRLEARRGGDTCVLNSQAPPRHLPALIDHPQYVLAPGPGEIALLSGGLA